MAMQRAYHTSFNSFGGRRSNKNIKTKVEQCKKADSFEHIPNKQLLIMKVKILQRSVYYKTAELEIEIPNDIDKFDIPEYVNENEDLWVDDIDHKINESEFIFGLGMDSGNWTDKDQDSEWRYECDELKIGGHL